MSDEVVDFQFELDEREIAFNLDEEVYPRDAIYGAAYLFIDRCYVYLSRPGDKKVRARLRSKEAATPEQLEALAGEFANELLNQLLRIRIGDSTARIREYYMARAFFTTESDSTINELLAELDDEEMEDDDLEIAVPWQKAPEGKLAPENSDV